MCDFCDNSILITIVNDSYNENNNYCTSCFSEKYKNTKFAITDKKVYISHKNPIIVMERFSFNNDTYIHVLFNDEIDSYLSSFVNSDFYVECKKQSSVSKLLIKNKNIVNNLISRFKTFDKIIDITYDSRIRYLTEEELIYLYIDY